MLDALQCASTDLRCVENIIINRTIDNNFRIMDLPERLPSQ